MTRRRGFPALPVERLADGSARYVTAPGDVVDLICIRHYGREWGVSEAVLLANPGLAERGPVLPAGISILLPAPPAAPAVQRRRLFD